ncbi:vWA domain-containing protein [Chryseobacterium oryctis]|uniref:VWA domain-containing protein n=1 Tax=Chryseobacterium oryctis TaxID=2952618 RepID=A0ABT3HRQ9_9FLAO|nr:vWA domain-containing protein [Chryseobacterium oryctis]MCW3162473.1 VWA domain-containing protein [Chryseobacterium oryctis]
MQIKNKRLLQALKEKVLVFSLLVLSLFTSRLSAQGVDVIFWMDTSGSIDATEWSNMTASTRTLIDEILNCNPYNRAAVVQYGSAPGESSKIYIEADFSNDATAVKNFNRRSLGTADYASLALSRIGNALDGVNDSRIVSSQKKLNKQSTNRLVIFLFTDASRGQGSSWLVSTGTGPAFETYNNFKAERGATFVVLHAPTGLGAANDTTARSAAAAIASVGGNYTGNVEANAGDPEGSGVKPRRFIASSTFDVSSIDLETLAGNICTACAPVVDIDAVTPPTQSVCLGGSPQALVASATGNGTLSYQWYSNTTNSTTGGTAIAGATSAAYTPPTSTSGTTYYYVVVADSYCEGTSTSSIVSVSVSAISCHCYKPANTSGTVLNTNQGITALGRAGIDNGNWPMVRKGAWTALESKEKGFVVNRIPTTAQVLAIANPIEGMMVYDEEADCLKIYTTVDGNSYSWQCFNTKACPD